MYNVFKWIIKSSPLMLDDQTNYLKVLRWYKLYNQDTSPSICDDDNMPQSLIHSSYNINFLSNIHLVFCNLLFLKLTYQLLLHDRVYYLQFCKISHLPHIHFFTEVLIVKHILFGLFLYSFWMV